MRRLTPWPIHSGRRWSSRRCRSGEPLLRARDRPTLQIFGSLVAAATCWGLFYDEINKFFFWPLHLSSYLLMAVPVPLFVGQGMVRDLGVSASLGPGWVPALLAGILILVVTLRARKRIDTYGGV
jgi:hypothetical protein